MCVKAYIGASKLKRNASQGMILRTVRNAVNQLQKTTGHLLGIICFTTTNVFQLASMHINVESVSQRKTCKESKNEKSALAIYASRKTALA